MTGVKIDYTAIRRTIATFVAVVFLFSSYNIPISMAQEVLQPEGTNQVQEVYTGESYDIEALNDGLEEGYYDEVVGSEEEYVDEYYTDEYYDEYIDEEYDYYEEEYVDDYYTPEEALEDLGIDPYDLFVEYYVHRFEEDEYEYEHGDDWWSVDCGTDENGDWELWLPPEDGDTGSPGDDSGDDPGDTYEDNYYYTPEEALENLGIDPYDLFAEYYIWREGNDYEFEDGWGIADDGIDETGEWELWLPPEDDSGDGIGDDSGDDGSGDPSGDSGSGDTGSSTGIDPWDRIDEIIDDNGYDENEVEFDVAYPGPAAPDPPDLSLYTGWEIYETGIDEYEYRWVIIWLPIEENDSGDGSDTGSETGGGDSGSATDPGDASGGDAGSSSGSGSSTGSYTYSYTSAGGAQEIYEWIDVDNDGNPESLREEYDYDEDGIIDYIYIETDANDDGVIEYTYEEIDGAIVYEEIKEDRVGSDGVLDYFYTAEDVEGVGHVDTIYIEEDRDSDGDTDYVSESHYINGAMSLVYEWLREDRNGDGHNDYNRIKEDTNEDGFIDRIETREDLDYDGNVDHIIRKIDRDGDRTLSIIYELKEEDTDGDGFLDYWYEASDNTGDETIDWKKEKTVDHEDTDGDGFIDRVYSYDYKMRKDIDGDGTLNITHSVEKKDTNGDGFIDSVVIKNDINDDEVMDDIYIEKGIDRDRDGTIDSITYYFEKTHEIRESDGAVVLYRQEEMIDSNGDGHRELYDLKEDTDSDGNIDYWCTELDRNDDGNLDYYLIMEDEGSDGVVDYMFEQIDYAPYDGIWDINNTEDTPPITTPIGPGPRIIA